MTHQQVQFEKPAQASSRAEVEQQKTEGMKTMNNKAQPPAGVKTMNELFQASDVIHTHTRAQLIEDGDHLKAWRFNRARVASSGLPGNTNMTRFSLVSSR